MSKEAFSMVQTVGGDPVTHEQLVEIFVNHHNKKKTKRSKIEYIISKPGIVLLNFYSNYICEVYLCICACSHVCAVGHTKKVISYFGLCQTEIFENHWSELITTHIKNIGSILGNWTQVAYQTFGETCSAAKCRETFYKS